MYFQDTHLYTYWLLWPFSSQNTEAKACFNVPLQKNIYIFGVRLCGHNFPSV